jgi:hypothetical protein
LSVTLVEEDGTGLPTANCFLTVAEANDILSLNPRSLWDLVQPDVKSNLLIWATRLLIERTKWKGRKKYETSGTPFPRVCLRDRDNLPITDTAVPDQVKTATALLAEFLSTTDPTTVNSAANLTMLQADVVKLEFDAQQHPSRWPPSIRVALIPIGLFSGSGGPKFIHKY